MLWNRRHVRAHDQEGGEDGRRGWPVAQKVDLKRTLDSYRAREGVFRFLDVPDHRYLMVDGHGDPNTAPAFALAIQTLYPVAYALKSASRRELDRDYVVPPLEGLWWAQDMDAFTTARDTSRWDWTLLLLVPDWVEPRMVPAAVGQVAAKHRPELLDDLRVQTLSEGRCVQTLHVGSFEAEAETLSRMHSEVIPGQGLRMVGRHHEIYLNDPRRTAPERLRVILRQPVAEATAPAG